VAKSRKSRRARRQDTRKQRRSIPSSPSEAAESAISTAPVPAASATAAEKVEAQSSISRQTINFIQEYFYVYEELRAVVITAVAMFLVMAALSFVF
jgi:hypothetical protein